MKYAAVMFDIVESRRYNDRYDVQNVLMESISYLNWVYGYAIKKEENHIDFLLFYSASSF